MEYNAFSMVLVGTSFVAVTAAVAVAIAIESTGLRRRYMRRQARRHAAAVAQGGRRDLVPHAHSLVEG